MGDKDKESAGSFEEAMARLESIVDQMESGELPLEEILARYEEGTRLVRACSTKLADAGKRIELIARNAAGEPEVVAFDPASEETAATAETPKKPKTGRASRASAPPSGEGTEDVSLF